MGTRICNGYKLNKMTLLQLHDFSKRVRASLTDTFIMLHDRQMAELCAEILDDYAAYPYDSFLEKAKSLNKNFHGESALILAHQTMLEHMDKVRNSNKSDTEYDFECEFSVHPIRGKILMMLFTEQPEYTQIIESMPEVSEYYYYDEEPPTGISQKEWDRRQADWDKALGMNSGSLNKNGIPSYNGFMVRCVDTHRLASIEEVLAAMPSLDERVNRIATNNVAHKYLKSKSKGNVNDGGAVLKVMEAIRYTKSAEGSKELVAESERIKNMLKPEYTSLDLRSPLKE